MTTFFSDHGCSLDTHYKVRRQFASKKKKKCRDGEENVDCLQIY